MHLFSLIKSAMLWAVQLGVMKKESAEKKKKPKNKAYVSRKKKKENQKKALGQLLHE